MKFYWLIFLSFLNAQVLLSQSFADKNYYLVDSLILKDLSADDQKLLDTCLVQFHKEKQDTDKINCINTIVNESWDELVWPKYNRWIFDFTLNKLTHSKNISKIEQKKLLGFHAGSLNNMGLYCSNTGKTKEALAYYLKALTILNKINENDVRPNVLNNLGILYNSQDDLDNALKYFKEALQIHESLGNFQNTANALNNIAFIYGKMNDYVKSKEYHLKSLKVRTETNDKRGIAESLNNLGTMSVKEAQALQKNGGNADSVQNKINLGLNYLKQSILIQQEIKDINGMANTYNNIAHIYFDKKDLAQAQFYGEESLKFAQQNNHALNTKQAAELLAKVYENQGKGMLALEMYKLFISTRDTIQNIETQKATITNNLQYEFEKKDALSKVENEKKIALAEANKNKQKMISIIVSIGLLIALALGLFAFNRYRVTNKQKLVIEQKNKEINLLLGEIHHRVKNNLQVVSSLLSLQERNISDENAKIAISEGKERVKSMGLIHKMLYQNDNYSGIEMKDFIEKLSLELMDAFGLDESKITVNLDINSLKLDVDTAVPLGLILNELIMNSLKYAFEDIENPILSIKLKEENNQMLLEFADNGKGLAQEIKESSNSFGIKLITSLTRQLNGNMNVSNDNGLKININFLSYKLV